MSQLNKYYRNYFTLDNVTSKSFGVGISGSGAFKGAERDIEVVHLERNGDLLFDHGCFHNRSMLYPCFMAGQFKSKFADFRSFLSAHMDKYYKLTDTYDSTHFHMARVIGPIDPQPQVRLRAGTFDVQFDCKPQRYRNDGDTFASAGASVTNPTSFPCCPIIRVNQNPGTVVIGGISFTVDAQSGENSFYQYVDIDCESMNVFAPDGTPIPYSLHNDTFWMENQKIVINPGETLTISANAQIKPRWFDM